MDMYVFMYECLFVILLSVVFEDHRIISIVLLFNALAFFPLLILLLFSVFFFPLS